MKTPENAIVAGVGPGLGAALVRKFASEGCRVAMFARSSDFVSELAAELKGKGASVLPVKVDVSRPADVARGFARVRKEFGPVDLLVSQASDTVWRGLLELEPKDFEHAWRVITYGAFLCCREVVPDMLASGGGTILFTGATSSVRGRGGAPAFSSAKFALRGFAESLAREFWPKGIHVAHVVIDGMIDTPAVRQKFKPKRNEPLLEPDAIAEAYWSLVQQPRSAWTLELDLRPHHEEFFV